jgi:hypothetical protein
MMLAAPRPARSQQAPTPAPEIQRMTALAGTFEGQASFTSGGKTVQFKLRQTNRVISGGFGLAAHEEADLPGMGHYVAEDLFGWDPGKKQLHLFTVSNDPNTHDHAGRWADATHASLRYEGLREGKRYVEMIPLEVKGPDEYIFKCTSTLDGGAPEVFAADMKRVKGK